MESTTSIEGDRIAPFYGELFLDPPPWSAQQQAEFLLIFTDFSLCVILLGWQWKFHFGEHSSSNGFHDVRRLVDGNCLGEYWIRSQQRCWTA
jgi:hypothetical protein